MKQTINLKDFPALQTFLKKRLKELGINQDEIASKMNISRVYFNMLINGKSPIGIDRLREVAKISNMREQQLYESIGLSRMQLEKEELESLYSIDEWAREVWYILPRHSPFFNPKLIENRDDFTHNLEKFTFWGGARSDICEVASEIERKLGYKIRAIKGPKWLDYLSCRIYEPSSIPFGQEIFTGGKNSIELRPMEYLSLTRITDDLRYVHSFILDGEKVEGFELV